MKYTIQRSLATLALLVCLPAYAEEEVENPCLLIDEKILKLISEDPDKLIEIVAKEVALNSACSCEILKAAIAQSKADGKTVAALLEAAIMASPQYMELMVRCSLAAAPDAHPDILNMLKRLGISDSSSSATAKRLALKFVKSPNVMPPMVGAPIIPNPLDPPGGLIPVLPPVPELIIPPVINPPATTTVDP